MIEPVKLSDAQLIGWSADKDGITVRLINWQEKPVALHFTGVSVFSGFAAFGGDLSHLESSDELPPGVEQDGDLRSYRLVDADDQPVMTIVAEGWSAS